MRRGDGSWLTYTETFVILDMKENEVIIGLPAILRDLWDFFVSSVEADKNESKCKKVIK